jgi:glycerophosphoryl diester phosphodiesterase
MATELLRDRFELIAYRGGAGERPENTMEAFAHAVALSPEIILDLDLQFSKDHLVVVFHDMTIDRTTNGSGNISGFDLGELKKFDAAYHFLDQSNQYQFRGKDLTIPTLEEVLVEFPNSRFILDIRRDDATHLKNIIDLVERLQAVDRVIIVSESDQVIGNCRELRADWVYGAPTNEARMVVLGSMQPVSPIFMLPAKHNNTEVASPKLIDALHKWDRKIWFWTIDDPNDFTRLKNMNVDGLFTNYPERMLKSNLA